MSSTECNDKIRFSLSDESGALRFDSFAITDAPRCRDMERKLQSHLVGRPLSEVDIGYLRNLTCDGDGSCMKAVIQVIKKHQELFLGAGDGR